MASDSAEHSRSSPEASNSSPEASNRAAASAVLSRTVALDVLTPAQLRWRVASGRWQRPCPGVFVAHSGPLTVDDALRVALLWAGDGAVLAGLTAARLDGLAGFSDDRIHVLLPDSRQVRKRLPGLPVLPHRSRCFGAGDVHPAKNPPRTRIARSLVDAAVWMHTDRGSQAVLAAGVQQRLVRPADLLAVVARNPRLHRRTIILSTLNDIMGGAEALSEIDFTRLVIRAFGLPEPTRQTVRYDSLNRRRWLDAVWEEAAVLVEVDGIHHMDATQWWDDMDRENAIKLDGYLVLRFTAFVVRYRPGYVAAQIRAAFCAVGHPSAKSTALASSPI
jgi:hypothetical protein